ncbi:hypothetical protein OUZ56_017606 [Daphnia magna]|uniref:Uncharacterized protein n=1 Tax=Daphnia magna TaxID=35525 RepID=A0ABR0ATC8_9CRUS|nr:hypothetical protein OUZ56_017606 [Daphnia magna]
MCYVTSAVLIMHIPQYMINGGYMVMDVVGPFGDCLTLIPGRKWLQDYRKDQYSHHITYTVVYHRCRNVRMV